MFGISPQDVKQFVQQTWKFRFMIGSAPISYRRLRTARLSFNSSLLPEYLLYQYPNYELLECNGQRYAVVVFPYDAIEQFSEMEISSVLGSLDKYWYPDIITKHRMFYWLMRSGIPSYSHRTFIMKSLAIQPSIKLDCGIASYFDVLLSSYSLEWEILNAIARHGSADHILPQTLLSFMPLRQDLHNRVADPVKDGSGRACGIAVSVLLAYDDEQDSTWVMLRRRGMLSITLRRGLLHVLPSGNFQAPYGEYNIEYSVLHCVLWEFFEELFSARDPKEKRQSPKWFYQKQPVAELLSMINSGSASLYVTGVAVDLLNLRPELLLLLHIRDREWFSNHEKGRNNAMPFKFNEEWATPDELPISQEPLLKIRFPGIVNKLFSISNINPGQITPPGAAALWAGSQLLSKLISDD